MGILTTPSLTPTQARDLAAKLLTLADQVEAGATTKPDAYGYTKPTYVTNVFGALMCLKFRVGVSS